MTSEIIIKHNTLQRENDRVEERNGCLHIKIREC